MCVNFRIYQDFRSFTCFYFRDFELLYIGLHTKITYLCVFKYALVQLCEKRAKINVARKISTFKI